MHEEKVKNTERYVYYGRSTSDCVIVYCVASMLILTIVNVVDKVIWLKIVFFD